MTEEKCKFKTSIGGQALIEGILMRGPDKQAIVCKTPEGFQEKVEDIVPLKEKHPAFAKPFLRGIAALFVSLKLGMGALSYSASLQTAEIDESSKLEKWIEKKLGVKKAEKLIMAFALMLGLLLALFLFTFLPTFISGFFPTVGENLFKKPGRRYFKADYFLLIPICLLQTTRHAKGFCLSRSRAQKHLLLRKLRGAHG